MGCSATLRTRVKMCGTTRLDDALLAVELGVDGLGFIFYPKSPRYIVPAEAAEITAKIPPLVHRFGVFVNASLKEVADVAQTAHLSCLQLHGGESPAFCRQLREQLPCCLLVKAFRVGEQSRAEEFAPYNSLVDAFLLDTYKKGEPGGTGQVFDWKLIQQLSLQRPLILAGGLNADNVLAAIGEISPFAVDVNSGVELSPGVKDKDKLISFMEKIHGL